MLDEEMKQKQMLKIGLILVGVILVLGLIYLVFLSTKEASDASHTGSGVNQGEEDQNNTENNEDENESHMDGSSGSSGGSHTSSGSQSESSSTSTKLSRVEKEKMDFIALMTLNIENDFLNNHYHDMNTFSHITKILVPYFYAQKYESNYGTFVNLYENCKMHQVNSTEIERVGNQLFGSVSYEHQSIGSYSTTYLGNPIPYNILYQDGIYRIGNGTYCGNTSMVLPGTGYSIASSEIYFSGNKATSYVQLFYRQLVDTTSEGQKYAYYLDAEKQKTLFYLIKKFSDSDKDFMKTEEKKISIYQNVLHEVVIEFRRNKDGIPTILSTEMKK